MSKYIAVCKKYLASQFWKDRQDYGSTIVKHFVKGYISWLVLWLAITWIVWSVFPKVHVETSYYEVQKVIYKTEYEVPNWCKLDPVQFCQWLFIWKELFR